MEFVIRFFRDVPRKIVREDGTIVYQGLDDYCQSPKRSFHTIEEAEKHRKLSGDIICDKNTGFPSTSAKWLWEFEKKDRRCYAQRMRAFSFKALGIM